MVRVALVVGSLAIATASPVHAQDAPPPQPPPAHNQVISANPFGVLLGLFNAEFERKVSRSGTLGVGGSAFPDDADDYYNADVFYRFYPSGRPFEGFSFGVKVGVTSVEGVYDEFGVPQGRQSFFGLGFDANWSWLLGKDDNFYVGLGFGLKRLFGTDDGADYLEFIPTIRLVNIGIAF
jgi:hypothetical protein